MIAATLMYIRSKGADRYCCCLWKQTTTDRARCVLCRSGGLATLHVGFNEKKADSNPYVP